MAKRRWRRLTPEVRREVIRLARNGATYRDIKGGLDLPNGTIGLLATNTIAQGETRTSGLQFLLREGLVIYDATRSMPWPGAAA